MQPVSAPRECWTDCDGNGSIACWHCGGEGGYEVPTDDCGGATGETCDECKGSGILLCPGDLHDRTDHDSADAAQKGG